MNKRYSATLTGVLLIFLMLSQQDMVAENGTGPYSTLPNTDMIHTSAFVTNPVDVVETHALRSVGQLGGVVNSIVANGKYLYAGLGRRLAILDATNPNHLRLIGQTDILDSLVTRVSVESNHVYMITENRDLVIVDTEDPFHPSIIVTYHETQTMFSELKDFIVYRGLAYIVDSDSLQIVDVSIPINPHPLGSYEPLSNIETASVIDTYLYLGGDLLTIVDTTDPLWPTKVGSIDLGETIKGVAANDMYVFAGTFNGVRILDRSQPDTLVEAGWFKERMAWGPVTVIGNLVFAAHLYQFYAVDVSNPEIPVVIGEWASLWPVEDITFSNDMGYVLVKGDVHVLQKDEANNIRETSRAGLQSIISWDIDKSGRYAYTVGNKGLQTFDVGDPASPVYFSCQCEFEAWAVAVAESYVYTVGERFRVFSLTNPKRPSQVGTYDIGLSFGHARDIEVSGGYAYVAGGDLGLRIVSVVDPTNPIPVGTLELPGHVWAVEVVGNYAYVIAGDSMLVLDVSDPINPPIIGVYGIIGGDGRDVFLIDQTAYVADFLGNALKVIDVSNPSNPIEVTSVPVSAPLSVVVEEPYAYVLGRYELSILDVTDSQTPTVLATLSSTVISGNLVVNEGTIYIADGNNQVTTLQHISGVSKKLNEGAGTITSEDDQTTYYFSTDTFSTTTIVNHTRVPEFLVGPLAGLLKISTVFNISAVEESTGYPSELTKPYTITLAYNPGQLGPIREDTLALFSWDGLGWTKESTSVVDVNNNEVTAALQQLGHWVVAGTASMKMYMPSIKYKYEEFDIEIFGIEVTQTIQDMENSVPLVTGRPTVARVYAQTNHDMPFFDIYLSLEASLNGMDLPGSPLLFGPWALYQDSSRGDGSTSFNVPIPASWISGDVKIIARVDPANIVHETDEGNNAASVTLKYQPLAPLSVKIIPVSYTHEPSGTTCPVRSLADDYSHRIMSLFPVPEVSTSFRAPMDFYGDLTEESENTRLLAAVRTLKQTDGAPPWQVYYGIFPPSGFSEICSQHGISRGWLGSRASIGIAAAAAHEIGHNFGLLHAPCGNVTAVDHNYPYPDASIGQYGFNTVTFQIWSPEPPDFAKDLMSYCRPRWISDYNYRKLIEDQAENGGPVTGSSQRDNFLIHVSFDQDGNAVIHPVYSIPSWSTASSRDSKYVIELLDAMGSVVYSQPVSVVEMSLEPGRDAKQDQSRRAIFTNLPYPSRPVSRVRLIQDQEILAEREFVNYQGAWSAEPVSLVDSAESLSLSWNASNVPVLVRYTANKGKTWTTIGLDEMDGELEVDKSTLPVGYIQFEVRPADSIRPVVRTISVSLSN